MSFLFIFIILTCILDCSAFLAKFNNNICVSLANLPLIVRRLNFNRLDTVPVDCRLSFSKLSAFNNLESSGIRAEGSGNPCRIKVIGVGGGGGNAVNRMVESSIGVSGVELWVLNTDIQALTRSLTPNTLKIGNIITKYNNLINIMSLSKCNR
jgi:hypothetical protein